MRRPAIDTLRPSAILSRNKTAAQAAALGEGVTAMIDIPSPAVAVVGRHNSGKTTLIERLIAELTGRGLDVGSIKHHSHRGFDIDIPGKDSYRHRAAFTNRRAARQSASLPKRMISMVGNPLLR